MPVPSPHKGESQQDFMARCLGDATMLADYKDQEQHAAVCYSAWRDVHGGKAPEQRAGMTDQPSCPVPTHGEDQAAYMDRCQALGNADADCADAWDSHMAAGMGSGSRQHLPVVKLTPATKGMKLNGAAVGKAKGLIGSGRYDASGSWSFSADDGNALLGAGGDDWSAYAAWFLGEDTAAEPRTKERYKYPFGKGGKVYASALRAIRSRASQQGASAVFDAAGRLLDELNAKEANKSAASTNRAYSVLEIKGINEGERVIRGIATTPSTDHVGDIVDSLGAEYKLPIPLLWQHQADNPVGHVEFAEPTEAGIPFHARIARIDEPGDLKNLTDKAWQAVKAKLVRGVSIGFSPREFEPIKGGGLRFKRWVWHELSLVTIPANVDATITLIRSLDTATQLDGGGDPKEPQTTDQPGLPAKRREATAGASASATVKVTGAEMAKKSIAEQISAFENTRAAKQARMDELMDDAGDRGETLNEAETEEYDGLALEIKAVDEHLVRLRSHERSAVQRAQFVHPGGGGGDGEGGGHRLTVSAQPKRASLPKGTAFTRYVIAMVRSKGDLMQAAHIAQQWEDTPEVHSILAAQAREGISIDQMKAAVAAGTTSGTTWAAPLVNYQVMTSEFIEYLRPATIIGRIDGFRRVPFNIKVPSQTSGSTVGWVGEGSPKPLSALAFDSVTLTWTKIAGMVVLTQELMRFSSPSVEAIVRQDLVAAISQFMDQQFVDPTISAQAGVRPASVTNGVTPKAATGATADDFRDNARHVISGLLAANLSMAGSYWIMTQDNAAALSLMMNSLGQPQFPNITVDGGSIIGLPVITSQNIPSVGNSPADGYPIILLKPSEILMADDGGVTIDASQEASVQMDSAPDSPVSASTTFVSLWQSNMVALRAEREINWVKRRSAAVQYISYAKYGF